MPRHLYCFLYSNDLGYTIFNKKTSLYGLLFAITDLIFAYYDNKTYNEDIVINIVFPNIEIFTTLKVV